MQSKFFILAIFSLLTFASCHKHDDEGDTQAPVLTIEDPIEGESISGEVHIHGKVTDESLHEMEIKVTKDSDGSELFKATPTVHDETEYDFDEHFTPSGLTGEIPVTLTITVEDHSDHTTTKTVKFKVKP
ncbi:MAG: hypothetical protein IT265_10335 [Saprospiraceae bacterium]|nr:hypothetical protein [Saprospiraceae bacterium]